jgi:hypothetical protein
MKISEDDIQILWVGNWYDGPLDGMCLYKGEKHWFTCKDEWGEDFWRRFNVVKLTPEQIAEEEKWHSLFVEKVGDSFAYENGKCVPFRKLKPESQWHEFYDEYEKVRDQLGVYDRKNPENVVAYFDME